MSILWVRLWLVYGWLSGIDPGRGSDVLDSEEIVVDGEGGIGDFASGNLFIGIVRVGLGFLGIGAVKAEFLGEGV